MKVTKNPFLIDIGWLHSLVLFLCFYPLAATIFGFAAETAVAYCLTGILLLVPIIISWYAVTYIRHMIFYILCALAVSCCFVRLAGAVGNIAGVGFYSTAVLSGILSFVLFLIRGCARVQKGMLQKRLEELSSYSPEKVDYRKLSVPVFLDAPHPTHWFFLGAQYVLGALMKSTVYWHMIYYLLVIDIFLCLAYRFPDGFIQFLHNHSRSANLPVKSMQKITRIIFVMSTVLLLLFVIPSFLYGKEPLSELESEPLETLFVNEASDSWEEDRPVKPRSDSQNRNLSALSKADTYSFIVLIYLGSIGIVLALLTLIYHACKNAATYFASESEDEIEFLDKELPGRMKLLRKKGMRSKGDLPVNLWVRRYYKKTIRQALKEVPKGTETPAQLEEAAGLKKTEECLLLHSCYEKARYSLEGCTAEEAEAVRKHGDYR